MSEERRLDVLRAIVEDYVATREPVGSRALTERHALGVSPATIRNDMAALEDAGLIVQPHTSAGRVPTEQGYREFVDRLSGVRALSAAERRAIGTLLEQAVDLDDVMDRAVRLIAQLTQQVAVVQYPSLRRSALRHVELVPVGARHLLVVIITTTGRVEQRTVELTADLEEQLVQRLRLRLNVAAAGLRLAELDVALDALVDEFAPDGADVARAVVDVVAETLAQEREERVVVAGASHLARSAGADFPHTIGPVLEALEEQVVLLRLLSEMAEDSAGVAVRIGSETRHEGLAETSIVTSGYGGENSSVAVLGAVGPLRMDYPQTMAAVRAVARYLTRILAG
ncbi:heat-inducible transcription repressor HrcA [Cellulomonas flavigena DSM 20109]|uniref:Heat-inducible transcription repressor HrcA n=1 Tax=Cellulomonas flavigena (strain ATCC 482 / DSM 20109 / BCRC 11376 / JCM 18109 / NBRC 3775 / NCIMB 8073 / NRS 134) TaxID=446466 RepID=D5UGK3_CELFN|nr:heat-inducible transcriptional repressor HrcA [Cellulomonas flavigena]ADG75101.1 heat-inducible transcription repressor HrcA [Cellulomonas flavigena DSM 20109]